MDDGRMKESAMSVSSKSLGIDKLTVEERLDLIEEIWDGLNTDESVLQVTSEQREELDRRLDELDAHPERVIGWETIKDDYKKRQGK